MRSRLALIGCSKEKVEIPTRARHLYQGQLFRKSLHYAARFDATAILSAKHGLLYLDEVIEPYDLSMRSLTRAQKLAWGQRVDGQLRGGKCGTGPIYLPSEWQLIFLCGEEYVAPIEATRTAWAYERPLAGLGGIGGQLRWLNQQ